MLLLWVCSISILHCCYCTITGNSDSSLVLCEPLLVFYAKINKIWCQNANALTKLSRIKAVASFKSLFLAADKITLEVSRLKTCILDTYIIIVTYWRSWSYVFMSVHCSYFCPFFAFDSCVENNLTYEIWDFEKQIPEACQDHMRGELCSFLANSEKTWQIFS